MTSDPFQDGFIPLRTRALAAMIQASGGLAEGAAQASGDVFKLLAAVLHYEAHAELEALKTLYDPLDPDAPPSRRDATLAAYQAFEAKLAAALERANYTEIDPGAEETLKTTRHLTGLHVKASPAGIRSIRYYARGERAQSFTIKSWFGLRKRKIDARMLNDVIVIVAFKSDEETEDSDRKAFAKLRRGMRPGAVLVKHFRNVAREELVTLHPGATPRMQNKDRLLLGVPAVAAGVPVLLNLWPALTALFAVIALWFGAQGVIEDSQLKRALAAMSGLVAVIAFVMRQRLKFEAQSLKYQKRLADTVYFRNIANNEGVIDLMINAGEEQDAKEAMLAYWALVRADAPVTRAQIDDAVETYLRDAAGLKIDFEVHDAMRKLERLGLVTQEDGERYRAIAPDDARARLDAVWDALFAFAPASAV